MGKEWWWKEWIEFFASEKHTVEIISPGMVEAKLENFPFTVFMNSSLWQEKGRILLGLYPNLRVHSIKQDGSLVAIEVLQ